MDWNCPDVVLDPEDVSSIIPHLLTDDALLAYRLREQGLFVNQWYLVRAAEAVERALAMLNGRSI